MFDDHDTLYQEYNGRKWHYWNTFPMKNDCVCSLGMLLKGVNLLGWMNLVSVADIDTLIKFKYTKHKWAAVQLFLFPKMDMHCWCKHLPDFLISFIFIQYGIIIKKPSGESFCSESFMWLDKNNVNEF